MCGFAGWVGERNDALLGRLNRAQKHRGPDGERMYVAEHDRVSMIACRLVIADAAGGGQPMSDPVRGVTLVYTGELVNAPELRLALERRGHVFRSDHSDTEVLLRAYVEYGDEVVAHLNGMYAFVVHDARRHRLFGAVDRFAIKPLYFTAQGPSFAFATELKALLVLPWVDKRIDRQALYDAMSFHCVPAPRSIVAGVPKLGPAQAFSFDTHTSALDVRTYWRPAIADEPAAGGGAAPGVDADLSSACLDAIDAALRRWSTADVPIGVALSGGVDSSALVALAARRTAGAAPIRTYFAMLEGESGVSRAWARAVARQFGTDHREIVVRPAALAGELDAIVHHLDEPYGGSVPSWFLFREMARDVRVAITGLGADELFGNYGKWLGDRLPGDASAAARTRERAAALARRRYGRFHGQYASDEFKRTHLFRPDFSDGCRDSEARVDELRGQSGSRDPRSIVPFVDWHIQLPHELLHMTDRLSMAHGLEARPPFLDRELVDTVWSLPPSQRTRPTQPKGLLIDAVGPLLPPGLARAPKQGFAFPLDRLLSGALAERVSELLSPRRLRAHGIFRDDLLTTLAAPQAAGRRDLTQPLWSVLMMQAWCERFVGDGGVVG
jgi:asparagine synthase (glutamine-hydrolysing)